jgi:PspAA-like protein
VIVRILGEGQFRVGEDAATTLTALDKDLDAAVRDDQQAAFAAALHAAVALVRAEGTPLAADEIVTADYILPFSDATVDEVRKLLADGTIPGDSIGLP